MGGNMPSPDTSFDYDSIKAGYYDLVFHRCKGIQSKWHHLRLARIRQEIGNYRDHLDVGCGPGTLIGTLPQDKHSVGVDIASSQIHYATEKYGSEYHQFQCIEPSRPLPFKDNSFDVATILEVVEHLTNENNVLILKEINRVLRPGGHLVLTTPNRWFLCRFVEWLRDQIADVSYEEQHITYYNREGLEILFNDTGFVNPSISTYQFLAPFLSFINWDFPDAVEKIEPKFFTPRYGILFLAKVYKNNS